MKRSATRVAAMMMAASGLTVMIAMLPVVIVAALAGGQRASIPASTPYAGTLVQQRADSQLMKHTDGYYYFTATVPEYDRIVLRRSKTLEGLASAPETVVWRKHATGEMASHIWAPEIHFINGKWYIYFAAGHQPNIWDIRMYVLEGVGDNPLTADWTEKGQIVTGIGAGTFALDASTFVNTRTGKRYLIWAEKPAADSPINTNIYIAAMGANPWTIVGTPTMISSPTLPWETVGYKVNEGPTVLQRNGKLFLTYSASATDANYCLGMLTASADTDPLDAASWTKRPTPVFITSAATGQYGPGHNSFTTSEDGKTDILVYHDRDYRDIKGDPLNDVNRRTRIQPFTWNPDGTPDFGVPVADPDPVRIASNATPGLYIRHWEFRARLEANVVPIADSQFRVVPGLVEGPTVALESANFPGWYLRNDNGEAWVRSAASTESYRSDASFFIRRGLAGSGVSFEAVSYPPGRYLHRGPDNLMYVDKVATAAGRADATFRFDPQPARLPGEHRDPAPTTPAGDPPTASATATGSPVSTATSPAAAGTPPAAGTGGTGSGPANGVAQAPAGGATGGLARTGGPILAIAGVGAASVAVGLILYLLARRRRLRS